MRGDAAWGQDALAAAIDQLPDFRGVSVLHLGDDDDESIIDALSHNSHEVTHISADDAVALQLERRFDLVVIGTHTLAGGDDGYRRAVMHGAIQHIERAGHLIVLHEAARSVLGDGLVANDVQFLGSHQLPAVTLSLYRRGERMTVHDLLFEARATIARVTPRQLAERLVRCDETSVLDTRTHTDRDRFGVIPGSIHVPRTVVEWHFDPANGYLHPAMHSFDQPLVLVCNGGYSSSLAAANLVRLGFTNVADLIGGHTGWAAEGLPVERPHHSYLDTPSFERSDSMWSSELRV